MSSILYIVRNTNLSHIQANVYRATVFRNGGAYSILSLKMNFEAQALALMRNRDSEISLKAPRSFTTSFYFFMGLQVWVKNSIAWHPLYGPHRGYVHMSIYLIIRRFWFPLSTFLTNIVIFFNKTANLAEYDTLTVIMADITL